MGGLMLLGVAGCAGPAVEDRPTDLYLVQVSLEDGRVRLGPPERLTDREGWDNQPAFLPDGQSFLYASREEGQAEIYRYDLATRTATRLTRTPEREYSPQPLPSGDGFSVVRVEADGSRRLWSLDARGERPQLLLEWEDDVSYYTWIDAELALLHIEDEPNRLSFADLSRGWVEPFPLAESVGRSLQYVPSHNAVSFVSMPSADESWITEVDLLLRQQQRLVRTPPGGEDFVWLPSGELLLAHGSKILSWSRDSAGWDEVADYAEAGLTEVMRIAVAPDGSRLVFVASRKPAA
jgi:dipeptidyl aminopeptidase/acylaminoacyl peptidase